MYLGVDIGSRQTKFALKTPTGIRLWEIPTPELYHKYMLSRTSGQVELAIDQLRLPGKLERIVATGYGRHNVRLAHATEVSEIIAHAQGALRTRQTEFCLLDLGGQDTKAVYIKHGQVEDFVVNDKCAAGSGRYLENMAMILGVDLETLFRYDQDPADLSTTCAVYGESELIGKMAEGVPITKLCAGVNYSVFLRLRPMLERWPVKQIVFVGGGAKNRALINFISWAGFEVIVPETPVFNGALGCLEIIKQELNA